MNINLHTVAGSLLAAFFGSGHGPSEKAQNVAMWPPHRNHPTFSKSVKRRYLQSPSNGGLAVVNGRVVVTPERVKLVGAKGLRP